MAVVVICVRLPKRLTITCHVNRVPTQHISQDNAYPIGPSLMFYKIFLDRDVARHFEGYDAFAIVEWDVVVAHLSSFQRLYQAAFHGSEEFWMKGSTLTGAEFHGTAGISDMWHVLGHLNGNAICESWHCSCRLSEKFTRFEDIGFI